MAFIKGKKKQGKTEKGILNEANIVFYGAFSYYPLSDYYLHKEAYYEFSTNGNIVFTWTEGNQFCKLA